MLVRAPLVEAEQDSSVRIEDLTKIPMGRSCPGLAEERLVPFEATRHIAYADDRPGAFHDVFSRRPNARTQRRGGVLQGKAHLVGRLEPHALIQRTTIIACVQIEKAHAFLTAPLDDCLHEAPR